MIQNPKTNMPHILNFLFVNFNIIKTCIQKEFVTNLASKQYIRQRNTRLVMGSIQYLFTDAWIVWAFMETPYSNTEISDPFYKCSKLSEIM